MPLSSRGLPRDVPRIRHRSGARAGCRDRRTGSASRGFLGAVTTTTGANLRTVFEQRTTVAQESWRSWPRPWGTRSGESAVARSAATGGGSPRSYRARSEPRPGTRGHALSRHSLRPDDGTLPRRSGRSLRHLPTGPIRVALVEAWHGCSDRPVRSPTTHASIATARPLNSLITRSMGWVVP